MNAPSPTGLTWLRRLTWWTLIGCLALTAGLVTAEPGVSRRVTVPAVLLVCGVAARLFAVAVLGSRPPRTPVLVLLLALAAPGAGGILGSSPAGGFPWALPLAALAAAVQAGAVPTGAVPTGAVPTGAVPTGAGRLGGGGVTGRGARWWVGLGFGVLAFVSALSGGRSVGAAAADTAIAALCATGLYAQIWILTVAERLDHARGLERTAAVTDERLRFAAELHDIQGHSLQVIALKSELAERLADTDPARAAAEMREVQALARQALGDTREVVHGYRQVALDTELANAVRVLEAAGIEAALVRAPGSDALPAEVATLLGLVARECTTNVLRHSDARRCSIELAADDGFVRLRFTNDAPRADRAGPAGGLAALGDRVAAAGGELTSSGTAGAFTVSARVPVS